MSRFRNEVTHLQAHVRTLRIGVGALAGLALVLAVGWSLAPRHLTIHVPPDLRTGSTRLWWDVPPESVYAFGLYAWQQLHRWPTNGEEDYARNLRALAAFFSASCQATLRRDYDSRRVAGELRQRVRGLYELAGRGYSDPSVRRVRTLSDSSWAVTLDVAIDEYYASERVKRALIRYPLIVTRQDVDPKRNPWGLVIDCYESPPQRLATPADATSDAPAPPPRPDRSPRSTP